MPNIPSNKARFTKRRGILLIILAPIVFVLSGLSLANQTLYSPQSLQYQIGELLTFIISPLLLILGITIWVIAKIRTSKPTLSHAATTYPADQTNLSTEPSNSSSQSQGASLAHLSKTDKPKSDMPRWERWARRIYFIGVLIPEVSVAFIDGIVFVALSPMFFTLWLLPAVMGVYLLKGRRGHVLTWLLVILALLSFVDLLPFPLSLLMGPAAIQLGNYYTSWIIGLEPYGRIYIALALRSAIVLSASIFLVVAQLRQHPKIERFTTSRVFKVAAVAIILLPLLLMPFIQVGEPTPNTNLNPKSAGVSGFSSLTFDNPFQKTSRTFNSTTGLWTYTLALSNQGETTMILHVWAGFETISPLGTHITVLEGTDVSASDAGIVFQRGANGTIRFSTTQGHNTVTLDLGSNARCVFEW